MRVYREHYRTDKHITVSKQKLWKVLIEENIDSHKLIVISIFTCSSFSSLALAWWSMVVAGVVGDGIALSDVMESITWQQSQCVHMQALPLTRLAHCSLLSDDIRHTE